jgi:hypothetical protein
MASVSAIFFGGVAAVIAAGTAGLFAATGRPIFWGVFLVVGAFFLGFHWYSEYRKRTYDPVLAVRFTEKFDALKRERCRAAKLLRESGDKLSDPSFDPPDLSALADVIDFFEELGFFTHGDQLSAEVAHHQFYHWIRGYYSAAVDYIKVEQSKAGEESRWQFVKILFELTSEVEDERTTSRHFRLLGADLTEFLDDEISSTGCKEGR